jgi:hypothetical protein
MTVTETTAVYVGLERGCGSEFCNTHASSLYQQLAGGRYDWCAAMRLPGSLDEWRAEHRTARKRVDRCRRRGYTFRPLARELHNPELHAINVSSAYRQGRPMTSAYLQPPTHGALPHFPCGRHAIRTHGVWSPTGTLVAYITVYRAGDLVLVSQILGHARHEENEVMYLLFAGALEQECRVQPGVVVYNRWDSGTDGLRFFKSRLGFSEARVEWLP